MASSHALCLLREFHQLHPFVFEPAHHWVRRHFDAPRNVGASVGPSGRPGSRCRTSHLSSRSEKRQCRISARPRAPETSATSVRSVTYLRRDIQRTIDSFLELSIGFFQGLRAHITAPKSPFVNPTHILSPRRLSVSSSLLRGLERPFRKPRQLPTELRRTCQKTIEHPCLNPPKNLASALVSTATFLRTHRRSFRLTPSFRESLCQSVARLSAPKRTSTIFRPTSGPIGSSTNRSPMGFLSPTTYLR